jgi:hypothetical protein
MNLEDMLCDACLYKVESNHGEFPVKEMCDRCQNRLLKELVDIASEVSRADEDHERLLERWKP